MTSPVHPSNPAAELRELAHRVHRLAPDRRDPERYHVDKSEIAAMLRQLAARIERAD